MAPDQKIDVGNTDGRSAVASEKCDRFQLARFCFFQRALDIFGFPGSRQANEQIAGHTKGGHLACENFVESIIIARGSQQRAVARETNRRIRSAIFAEAYDKLGCEMRGVSRATPIAADEQFVSRAQTLLDQICRLCDLCIKIDERSQRFLCRRDRGL